MQIMVRQYGGVKNPTDGVMMRLLRWWSLWSCAGLLGTCCRFT